MHVWVLVLTFYVSLSDVPIIAQHQSFLFAHKDVCEQARPMVEARTAQWAPSGFTAPLTAKLTECMQQHVLSAAEMLDDLWGRDEIVFTLPPAAESSGKIINIACPGLQACRVVPRPALEAGTPPDTMNGSGASYVMPPRSVATATPSGSSGWIILKGEEATP